MNHTLRSFLLLLALTGGGPVLAEEPVEVPAYLVPPAVVYPRVSRRLGEQGTVVVRVYIHKDGSIGPRQVKRSSGYPRLDAAAVDGLAPVRFAPVRRGGEIVEGWAEVPLVFELQAPPAGAASAPDGVSSDAAPR